MKLSIVLILSLLPSIAVSEAGYRLTKIECNSSNKTIVNIKCWLKGYDRRHPVANVEVTFTRKAPKMIAAYNFFFALTSDQPFKRSIALENLECCKLLSGAASTPFIRDSVNAMRDAYKNLDKICKSTGLMTFHNITFGYSPFYALFPVGRHLTNYQLHDEYDRNIFNISFYGVLSK